METLPVQEQSPPRAHRPARNILPVALLIQDRTCLVVGAGVVAARKAETLIDAGAKVIIVAPDISDHAERLRDKSGVTLVRREYTPADLDVRPFLVVTATDSPALNRQILDSCHTRGILCACPESGDLISPAVFKHDNLTVSVSTGGTSCRRFRLIRDNLVRHAKAPGQADLLVIGTDHRFADIAQREELLLADAGPGRIEAGPRRPRVHATEYVQQD